MQFFYVYVGKRKRDEWYIGFTDDLERRVREHKAKYNFTLRYYEAFNSKRQAKDRERKLKHHGSAWRALRKRITA